MEKEKLIISELNPRYLLERLGFVREGDLFVLGRKAYLFTDSDRKIVSYRYDEKRDQFLYAGVLTAEALQIQLRFDINF
jgi:hypothetical protein